MSGMHRSNYGAPLARLLKSMRQKVRMTGQLEPKWLTDTAPSFR